MCPLAIFLLLALFGGLADCAKKSSSGASPVKAAPAQSASAEDTSIIEEVSAKQLERLLQDKDYVAVYWCKCLVTTVKRNKGDQMRRKWKIVVRKENGSYIIQEDTRPPPTFCGCGPSGPRMAESV